MLMFFTILGVALFLIGAVVGIICECKKINRIKYLFGSIMVVGFVILLYPFTHLVIKGSERECPECQGKCFTSQKYCEDCGYNFKPECKCGVLIDKNAKFCANCGREIVKEQENES